MSPTARGAFIVIEGLDRSGKSTQAARLLNRIQSTTTDATSLGCPPKAVLLKFPGQSPSSSSPLCVSLVSRLFDSGSDALLLPRILSPHTSPSRVLNISDDDGRIAIVDLHMGDHAARAVRPPSDRTTAIGKMIDAYLRSESELDDHAIHLLFAANRWERASVHFLSSFLPSNTLSDSFFFFLWSLRLCCVYCDVHATPPFRSL